MAMIWICQRLVGWYTYEAYKKEMNYLGPNFDKARAPCSSHSCLVTHMSSLSAI